MDHIRIPRRTHAQPQEPERRSAEKPADRDHGTVGLRKIFARFDTLYAEGQRRYVESLSAYARQFLQLMEKPDVESIEGLSPAISIEQKAASHKPALDRGHHHRDPRLPAAAVCARRDALLPGAQTALQAQSVSQMVDHALHSPGYEAHDPRPHRREPQGRAARAGSRAAGAQGFARLRVDGKVHEIDSVPRLSKNIKHSWTWSSIA